MDEPAPLDEPAVPRPEDAGDARRALRQPAAARHVYKQRGRVAKRKRDEEPKEYPLAGEDWSSQDESEESQDETEAKEINIELTGKPQKKKKGSAVEDGP